MSTLTSFKYNEQPVKRVMTTGVASVFIGKGTREDPICIADWVVTVGRVFGMMRSNGQSSVAATPSQDLPGPAPDGGAATEDENNKMTWVSPCSLSRQDRGTRHSPDDPQDDNGNIVGAFSFPSTVVSLTDSEYIEIMELTVGRPNNPEPPSRSEVVEMEDDCNI